MLCYTILYYPILYYTILFYACTCAIIDYCVLYYIVYYHPSRTELECYVLAQIIIVHSLFTKPFSTIFCGCTWKYFSLCFALSQLVPPYPIITCPTLSYHNLSHLILSQLVPPYPIITYFVSLCYNLFANDETAILAAKQCLTGMMTHSSTILKQK